MTAETEQPDPSRVSEQSGTPEPRKRQVPGVPVGPPRQESDVDQETHEALQMKVAMKMVGSAMVFIGFIQVFMSASTGAIAAVNGGQDLLPPDKKAAVTAAWSAEDIANLQFFANIPPGIEDMEGKALEKIKAATGG